MLIRSRETRQGILTRWFRSRGGLWFPDLDLFVPKHNNVLAVLGRPEGKYLIPAANIVTDAGDLHYAQRAVTEALTNDFDTHLVATATTGLGKATDLSDFTEVAASEKTTDVGYPVRNDTDGDNTGAGVDIVTHLVSYTTGDFNATAISHGLITNATPGTAEPILTGYAFAAPFDKTASDTLKVFVNHEMSGQ
jgi:hypothetical protein